MEIRGIGLDSQDGFLYLYIQCDLSEYHVIHEVYDRDKWKHEILFPTDKWDQQFIIDLQLPISYSVVVCTIFEIEKAIENMKGETYRREFRRLVEKYGRFCQQEKNSFNGIK